MTTLVAVSATTALFGVLAAWLLVGIVCSAVMARRGHDPWSWGALGAVLGPLVVPLALGASRREAGERGIVRATAPGTPGGGPIGVLAGLDGSPEALAAAVGAVSLLGPRLGTLTLATVVDYDTAGTRHQDAARMLDEAAAAIAGVEPATVVLVGKPANELLEYATSHDVDVVTVGARGRGLSRAVLGSTASALVRQHDVLVLVAGHVPTAVPG